MKDDLEELKKEEEEEEEDDGANLLNQKYELKSKQ